MANQGSDKWKIERCGKITGSRFGDATNYRKDGKPGSDLLTYRAELITERLTGKPVEHYVTYDMRIGVEREPLAMDCFTAATGIPLIQCGYIPVVGQQIGASPDALIGSNCGIEIKCPTPKVHGEYLLLKDGEAPEQYIPQVQGGMLATHRKYWFFVSYNPDYPVNMQLVVRLIKRDDAYIDAMYQKLLLLDSDVNAAIAELKAQYAQPQYPKAPK